MIFRSQAGEEVEERTKSRGQTWNYKLMEQQEAWSGRVPCCSNSSTWPAASESPGNSLEMQNLGPHLKSSFNKTPR